MATVELGPRLHPADDHATAEQCRGFELFRRERLKLLEEQLDRSRHAAAVLDAALDLSSARGGSLAIIIAPPSAVRSGLAPACSSKRTDASW